MVVERPREAEPLTDLAGEDLDAQLFGSVVAGVDHIDAPLVSIEEGVMGSFAGNEGIAPDLNRFGDHVTRTAGHDPDPAAGFRPPRQQSGLGAEFLVQVAHQSGSIDGQP